MTLTSTKSLNDKVARKLTSVIKIGSWEMKTQMHKCMMKDSENNVAAVISIAWMFST